MEPDIVKNGFEWLSSRQISTVKELANCALAHALWMRPDPYITPLFLKKEGTSWNSSVRDTARACSALAVEGIRLMAPKNWLLAEKQGNSWNEDVYDTCYALGALADMGILVPGGCRWLYENYGPAWEHVGTTSLIITALKKQESLGSGKEFRAFVRERAEWVLSEKSPAGGWAHISTSNLAVQALLLAGFKPEVGDSVRWLLDSSHKTGAWGNRGDEINATSLTLGSLGLYFIKIL